MKKYLFIYFFALSLNFLPISTVVANDKTPTIATSPTQPQPPQPPRQPGTTTTAAFNNHFLMK